MDYIVENRKGLVVDEYSCDGMISRHCDKSHDIVAVSKNHLKGKTRKDVVMLFLSNQTLSKLPKNLDKFFPNLSALDARHMGLKEISSEDLNYPRLKVLYLGHNKLTTLSNDLFKNTPKLELFAFEYNEIKQIGGNTFNSLRHLKYLYPGHNVCTNLEATDDVDTIKKYKLQFRKTCASKVIRKSLYFESIPRSERCRKDFEFLEDLNESDNKQKRSTEAKDESALFNLIVRRATVSKDNQKQKLADKKCRKQYEYLAQ